MTDTTKPNGDRDRPSDRETAKNPRVPAMDPPEGTASSGSTSPPLDMALLRELPAEFGFWPATTDPDDIERHSRQSAEADANHAAYLREYGPGGYKRHRWEHLKRKTQWGTGHLYGQEVVRRWLS